MAFFYAQTYLKYSQLSQKYGYLVLFLHHTNKRSDNFETRTHYELLTQKKERRETIEYEYEEIMALKQLGLTHKEIGLELGISEVTVGRKLSKYKKLKSLEESNP